MDELVAGGVAGFGEESKSDMSEETWIVSWFSCCCSDADELSGGKESMGVSNTSLDDG